MIRPHLLQFNIDVSVRKVLTSRKLKKRGGIVSFGKFRNDVTQWIKEEPAAWHTTCIDLYGLKTDFPGFEITKHLQPYSRVESMEKQMGEEINFHQFIPYIQLHEFETLLFADPGQLETWLSLYNKVPVGKFQEIRDSVDNPELINEDPSTAPSKRILAVCNAYDKVDDGILILQEIGLPKLREECPHFNDWITKLEQLK